MKPRLFASRRLNHPMRFSVGPREYDLQPGDWVLVFEDGKVSGWTEAQRVEAVRWAESGGTLSMPQII